MCVCVCILYFSLDRDIFVNQHHADNEHDLIKHSTIQLLAHIHASLHCNGIMCSIRHVKVFACPVSLTAHLQSLS